MFLIVRTHILLGVSGLYFACVLILQELNTFSGQIATVARLFCACVVFVCMVFVWSFLLTLDPFCLLRCRRVCAGQHIHASIVLFVFHPSQGPGHQKNQLHLSPNSHCPFDLFLSLFAFYSHVDEVTVFGTMMSEQYAMDRRSLEEAMLGKDGGTKRKDWTNWKDLVSFYGGSDASSVAHVLHHHHLSLRGVRRDESRVQTIHLQRERNMSNVNMSSMSRASIIICRPEICNTFFEFQTQNGWTNSNLSIVNRTNNSLHAFWPARNLRYHVF